MGREADVEADIGGALGTVRVLLEGGELIVRGAIRRRYDRSAIRVMGIDGDWLRLDAGGEAAALRLGAQAAARWAAAIVRPAPACG